MDHLLRKRGRGGFGLPVSTLSRIAQTARCGFFFGCLSGPRFGAQPSAKRCDFLEHRVPEGQEVQRRPTCVNGDGRTAVEVHLIPSIWDHVATVHVADQDRGLCRPGHVSPWCTLPLGHGQITGEDEAVVSSLIRSGLCFARLERVIRCSVGQPCVLAEPRGEQQAA